MTPRAMVTTALLLGAFVAMAGTYGVLYSLARLRERSALRAASGLSSVALCAIAAALLVLTPLHLGWKMLIAVSCAVQLVVPPVTWLYLSGLHRGEETRP